MVTETGAAVLHSSQRARNGSLDVELVELVAQGLRLLCGGSRHGGAHGALAGLWYWDSGCKDLLEFRQIPIVTREGVGAT